MSGQEIYTKLRKKEVASWERKYYPFKQWLLVPNIILPEGIRILKELYILLRELDDICDGDTLWYSEDIFIEGEKIWTIVDFIISWKGNINFRNPLIKRLLDVLTQIYHSFWLETLESILDSITLCYNSLTFDKKRIEAFSKWNPIFENEDEIKKRLLELELYWILRPLLLLLWNKWFDIRVFEEMITLTRGDYYFSRDIVEDTTVWLFNYDVTQFPTQENAQDFMIQRWKNKIWDVVSETRWRFKELNIKGRIAIEHMYLKPAQRYFDAQK